MKLDRNLSPNHVGKYALIKLRDVPVGQPTFTGSGGEMLMVNSSAVDFGDKPETEFFVIRLKDKYAQKALTAYALAAMQDDPEYAGQVMQLAKVAGAHPNKRKPD